jgi:hypothetical protein
MTPDEISLLSYTLHEHCRVLEFGCGGSTQLFFEKGAKKLISIDSDALWLVNLLKNPLVNISRKYGKWTPLHADIGEIGPWGFPAAEEPRIRWLRYHQDCWDYFPERTFECILVDGRFRVACVCQSLLRCDTEATRFAIHDFWNRPEYHVVLDFLDSVDRKDSLGIFRAKSDIDWRSLSLVLQQHQFDAR